MVTQWKVLNFIEQRQVQKERFSAKLWSIDITGYNEEGLKWLGQTHLGPLFCQNRLLFIVNTLE